LKNLKAEEQVALRPPEYLPAPIKRAHNRHYLQQYFTKRAWNVAQHLIKHFTNAEDLVLDPFCGAGVIPVEALVLRRRAWACDINPWAVFITRMAAMAPVDLEGLKSFYDGVCKKIFPVMEQIEGNSSMRTALIQKSIFPKDQLPQVFQARLTSLDELFTEKQIAQLVLLRDEINSIKEAEFRDILRLIFSITLDRANKMYSAKGKSSIFGGQSAPFVIRRYQTWDDFTSLPITELFSRAYDKVVNAKEDANRVLDNIVNNKTFRVWEGSATELNKEVKPDSIDYILTDPPYGRNYNYLDLSMLWNAWLGFKVPKESFEEEIIQGGRLNKTADQYRDLLALALEQMIRVLKPGRWLTLIYSESKMENWSWLISVCRKHGLRYVDSCWSESSLPTHKKYQSPYVSAAGEYYLNFRRLEESEFTRVYGQPMRLDIPSAKDIVRLAIEKVIVAYLGASMELICNTVISKQLLGQEFLDQHGIGKLDIRNVLTKHFDANGGRWQLQRLEDVDPAMDRYDLLRYCLFHLLSRGSSAGMRIEDIKEKLPSLAAIRRGDLPLESIRGMLPVFASPTEELRWNIDKEKIADFSDIRLFFERSTVDNLRDFLKEPSERKIHAQKCVKGIAKLTNRLLDNNRTMPNKALRLALLVENVASAVVHELPEIVESVSAIDELASGRVNLDELGESPISLLIAMKPQKMLSNDQRFELSGKIFGPVLSEYNVWLSPLLVEAKEMHNFQNPKIDLMVY